MRILSTILLLVIPFYIRVACASVSEHAREADASRAEPQANTQAFTQKHLRPFIPYSHRVTSMRGLLASLVSAPTLQSKRDIEWAHPADSFPNLNDPKFKQSHPFQFTQLTLQAFARKAGLTFFNDTEPEKFVCPEGTATLVRPDCSHKVFVIELPGKPANANHPIGIYVHADVVPVGGSWQLTDDRDRVIRNLDPFELTFITESDLARDATRSDYRHQYAEALKQYAASDKRDQDALRWAGYLERKMNDLSGDRFYGRGTIDDKAQIVSSLFALKAIRDLQKRKRLPILDKPIQLIIETSEETTTEGIEVYLNWAKRRGIESTHEINLGLDANYPACIAENGIYREQLLFLPDAKDVPSSGLLSHQVFVERLHGAEEPESQARNTIPGLVKITFTGPGVSALKSVLENPTFLSKYENFLLNKWKSDDRSKADLLSRGEKLKNLWHALRPSTELTTDGRLILRIQGYERVSFKPMDSDSALIRAAGLFEFLNQENPAGEKSGFSIVQNPYTRMAHFVWINFGFDPFATHLGLAFSDRFDLGGNEIDPLKHPEKSFMGPLTAVPTMIDLPKNPNDPVALYVDMRVPRVDKDLQTSFTKFTGQARAALVALSPGYGFSLAPSPVFSRAPRFVDPNQKWMRSLITLYKKFSGRDEWDFLSIGGSTTASQALNGINFGPTQPFETDVYHVPNEFKKVSDFEQDFELFKRAFLTLGSLKD